jgi:internalin A
MSAASIVEAHRQGALRRIALEADEKTGSLVLRGLWIETLPPELQQLRHLKNLDLKGSKFASLSGLNGLSGLTSLDCVGTMITSLSGVEGLSGLTSLHCSWTQITSLVGLEGLSGLTSLNCSRTGITSLSGLEGLGRLTSLDCGGTKITSLSGVERLSGLTSLDCSYTKITSLSGVEGLSALTSLDCSYTSITSLFGVEGLSGLTSLDCSFTSITSLSGVEGLSGLTSLDCSYCRLTDGTGLVSGVPGAIWKTVRLPSLKELHSGACHMRGIPDELQSYIALPALRAYLDALEADPREVRATRLFLLGNGGAGKTQLRRTLLGQAFEADWNSTHGIETEDLRLRGPEGEEHRIDLWDFGGQEIYHGTHALFLQKTAVFVLVWTPQMEAGQITDPHGTTSTNQPLAYWLDYARQFGGKQSQILIVQTLRGGGADAPAPLPLAIPDDMAHRVQVVQIDNQTRAGRGALLASVLKAASAIIDLTGVTHLPGSWLDIGASLRQLRHDQPQTRLVPVQRYRDICRAAGLDRGQETLLHYLDATGVVLHNKALTGGDIILDPAWALDAIYALVRRDSASWQALLDGAGRFTLEDLGRWLWTARGLGHTEQQALLDFMLRAGMAFEHRVATDEGQQQTRYIAPAFLPDRPLSLVDRQWRAHDPATQSLSWPFALLHDGLVRTLLASIGQLAKDDGDYWRTGAQVFDAESRAMVRIEALRQPEGWAGEVRLQVQPLDGQVTPQVLRLLETLEARVEGWLGRFGTVPPSQRTPARTADLEPRLRQDDFPDAGDFGRNAIDPIRPARPGVSFFVSYAWHRQDQDDSEQPVGRFVAAARAAGFEVLRDKDMFLPGDHGNWVQFIEAMAHRGSVVFAFVGKTYLERFWTCYELASVRHAHGKHNFPDSCRVLALNRYLIDTVGLVRQVEERWTAAKDEAFSSGAATDSETRDRQSRLHTIAKELPDAVAELRQQSLAATEEEFTAQAIAFMRAVSQATPASVTGHRRPD